MSAKTRCAAGSGAAAVSGALLYLSLRMLDELSRFASRLHRQNTMQNATRELGCAAFKGAPLRTHNKKAPDREPLAVFDDALRARNLMLFGPAHGRNNPVIQ